MDYWRRYVGDYLAKTQALTMIEDGAYTRLLDYYYANEEPLPVSKAEIYEIARATNAAGRNAVDRVLDRKFDLKADGWHNDRADKEIAIARPAMDAKARTARENGKKGGRPKKTHEEPTPVLDKSVEENPQVTDAGCYPQPMLVPTRASQATPIPQPEDQEHRFPGDTGTPASDDREAVGAGPPKVNPDAKVRILAECTRAKVQDATAENPIVERWARNGATTAQVTAALIEARRSMPEPRILLVGYVDTILERVMANDRQVRSAAEHRVERTQEQIAEQRAVVPAPAPEAVIGRYGKRRAAS